MMQGNREKLSFSKFKRNFLQGNTTNIAIYVNKESQLNEK